MRKTYDDKSWSFLIASPAFSGPVFEESVVLLLEDSEDGSFGIIINKNSGKTLGELNADFLSTELADVEVFEGGPIAKDRISLALCIGDDGTEGSFSFGVSPDKAREALNKNNTARIGAFAGYAGWEPGQLQMEINEGTWIVCNADVNLMFDIPQDEIWEELVLRECPQYEKLPPPDEDQVDSN